MVSQEVEGAKQRRQQFFSQRLIAVAHLRQHSFELMRILLERGKAEGTRSTLDRMDRAENAVDCFAVFRVGLARSEEHTSALQSLMRISYAVFCLKKKNVFFLKDTANTEI